MHQLTRDLHLSVRNLRHHTLYAVGVVACHAPTNCTYTVGGEAPESPAAKYHLCKLCSSVPAQAAATTALNSKSSFRFSVCQLFCYCLGFSMLHERGNKLSGRVLALQDPGLVLGQPLVVDSAGSRQ